MRDRPVRLHQPQQRPEGGAHDARADQHDVGLGGLVTLESDTGSLGPSWSRGPLARLYRFPGYPARSQQPMAAVVEAFATAKVAGRDGMGARRAARLLAADHRPGPDPDGEGDLVATLVRAAASRRTRRRRAPCSRCTASPTTSSTPNWPTTSPPAASPSTRWTCTSAAGRGGRARRRTSPPTWPATTPNWSARWPSSPPTPEAQVSVCTATPPAGSSSRCGWTGCASAAAPPHAASPAWCSTARASTCTGPAILRTAPTSAALDRAVRGCARLRVVRPPTEGGYGTTLHRDYAR